MWLVGLTMANGHAVPRLPLARRSQANRNVGLVK